MDKGLYNLDKLISKTISFIVSKEMQAPKYFASIHNHDSMEQKEFIEYIKKFGLNSFNLSKILGVLGPAIYKNAEEIAEKEGLQGINKRFIYSLFSAKEEQDKLKEIVKKSISRDYDCLENLIKAG